MITALYRKYRPKSFSDVIGQEHIVGTLVNQIKNDRVGHAYLFTGSRGTGKTTCAKIFARAINCLNPADGSPCGECPVCKGLEEANNIDVMEIDAASNNGVDDAREIRERVKYPPVLGRYKVYIIDEVHMLTGSAFNALLKTLEEPPSHAVFILATTEVHKLPATILSRCMRFDFRLVAADVLTRHISRIFDLEGKAYAPEAARYVAEAGEGSVRDALSVADICLNCCEGELGLNDVLRVLGAADRSSVHALFEAVASGNLGGIFDCIARLESLGKSMGLIAKELISYSRDLLVSKTGSTGLIVDSPENIERMAERAKDLSPDFLTSLILTMSASEPELRYSISPRIILEAACIKAARLMGDELPALKERLDRLENRITSGIVSAAPQASVSSESGPSLPRPTDAHSVWGRMITYMRKNESVRLSALIGNQKDYEIADGELKIWAHDDNFLEFSDESTIAAIKRALSFDGLDLKVVVDKKKDDVDMDSEIEKLKKLMGGAKLKVIR